MQEVTELGDMMEESGKRSKVFRDRQFCGKNIVINMVIFLTSTSMKKVNIHCLPCFTKRNIKNVLMALCKGQVHHEKICSYILGLMRKKNHSLQK